MRYHFIFILAFLFNLNSFSQESYWVSTKLPGLMPTSYHYAVGETCIIFADDTSQAVNAFSLNNVDWKVLLVPTKLNWTAAAADGNAALIYNDSIVVGYSAITNTFATLFFSGTPLNVSGAKFGCKDNFAFFTTDQLFYVFDAEDAQWHSFSYTSPGIESLGGGVKGKNDYIYLDLWIGNATPHTLVAYSLLTKSFAEFTEPDMLNAFELDHGFTYSRTNEPYLTVGYSAFTGQFKSISHGSYISEMRPVQYDELVPKYICNLFVANEQLDGNLYRYYMWVFNTEIGDFAEYSSEYTYNGSNYKLLGSECGEQTAFTLIQNKNRSDILEIVVYSAETNSFSHFDTPLFYWFNESMFAGGLLIDGFDEHTYFLYDVLAKTLFAHPVEWTQSIQPLVNARALSNTWSVFAYTEQYEDTVHVFSYNRPDGSLNAFDIPGRASSSAFKGSNLYGLLITDNLGVPVKVFLYSPIYNHWMGKDLASTSYRGSAGNYFYANYTNLDQTCFYDAESNQEFWYPSAQQAQYVYAGEKVFLMYSNIGKYVGYSMNDHAGSDYEATRFNDQQKGEYVVLNLNVTYGSKYELLLYDGFNNIFAPLTLSQDQGIRRISWPGGKTAFIASQNGYLFAYCPLEINSIPGNYNIPGSMAAELHQNYPNPFNSVTKIKYTISPSALSSAQGEVPVTLKVYDFTGRVVSTLLCGHQPKGEHTCTFDGSDLPEGVYFYQLQVNGEVKCDKMIIAR